MTSTDQIYKIINSFPPLKKRVPEFKRDKRIKSGKDSYDWLVNEWIPSQKDSIEIMELTTLLNFNMPLVVCGLMGIERFEKQVLEINKG